MYKNEILLLATLFILTISGFNGYLIEVGLLGISQSMLNFLLDASLLVVAFFSIKDTPQIRKILFVFFIFILLTIYTYTLNVNELTPITYFNGLREFIPYFLFPIIYLNILQSSWRDIFIKKLNTFLYVFLALQIPVALYQFSIEGAGDAVGGTQGSGFSGILTFIVFLATFYLMTQGFDENNIFGSIMKKSYLFIFWLPAFINETKVSYLFIPLFLFLLVKIVAKNIPKYFTIILILIPSLFIFNIIYQSVTPQFDSKEFLSNDFLANYLASDDELYEDIPRFQKIAIFMHDFDTKDIFFGKGIGQFKGGTTLGLTHFATMYEWLLKGSIPMLFFLLVQIGVIGAIIFTMYWIVLIIFRTAKPRVNFSTNLIIFSTVSFIIIQFYNDSFRSLFFCGMIMYVMCYAISPSKTEK